MQQPYVTLFDWSCSGGDLFNRRSPFLALSLKVFRTPKKLDTKLTPCQSLLLLIVVPMLPPRAFDPQALGVLQQSPNRMKLICGGAKNRTSYPDSRAASHSYSFSWVHHYVLILTFVCGTLGLFRVNPASKSHFAVSH